MTQGSNKQNWIPFANPYDMKLEFCSRFGNIIEIEFGIELTYVFCDLSTGNEEGFTQFVKWENEFDSELWTCRIEQNGQILDGSSTCSVFPFHCTLMTFKITCVIKVTQICYM